MDPNNIQNIIGLIGVQQLDQELRRPSPFAEYDVLTSDEPIQVWQLAKRLLKALKTVCLRAVSKYPQTLSQQSSNI